jgi:hypothetical protein
MVGWWWGRDVICFAIDVLSICVNLVIILCCICSTDLDDTLCHNIHIVFSWKNTKDNHLSTLIFVICRKLITYLFYTFLAFYLLKKLKAKQNLQLQAWGRLLLLWHAFPFLTSISGKHYMFWFNDWFIVLSATFSNISAISENHWPWVSNW